MNDLTIAIRSYKRADKAFTHKYLTDCVYVVAESEAMDYQNNGLNVWACPDKEQGNICRVTNWILDNCKTKYLIITDDDLSYIGRWEGNNKIKLTEDKAIENFEMCFNIAEQLQVPFWGMNCIADKGAYREYSPFSFVSYIGGGFQAFILPNFKLRYDEKLMLKEDYDMTLQVANKYRLVPRFNFLHYELKQHENSGGCATYRTIEREKEQFYMLQKKWGTDIVKMDNAKRSNKGKIWDINPIIKVPIKGI